MAKKEISIVIRAKNAVAAGLAKAEAMFKSFAGSVAKVGKTIALGMAAATASVVAFSVKALSAYAEQQKAEMALAGSLRAYGESADAVMPKLKEIAARIQDETGAADESTLAGMAKIRMLGVQTDKLEEAAKASLALKSIGIEEAAAQRYVALAMQGNYTMLQRYIPALRTATDEADKAQIVNEFLARGYQQQKDLLNTTSGAWRNLKGRIGDALERIGEAIDKSAGIKNALNQAAWAVKNFGDAVGRWIQSEKFQRLQTTLDGIVAAMKQGGAARGDALKAVADVIKSAFAVAVENAVSIFKKAAPTIGKMIGLGAQAVWDAFKPQRPTPEEVRTAAEQLGIQTDEEGAVKLRGKGGLTSEQRAAFDRQIKLNRLQKTTDALKEDNLEAMTEAEIRLDAALKELFALGEKYAPEVQKDEGEGEGEGAPLSVAGSGAGTPYDPTGSLRNALEFAREQEAAQKDAVENAAKNEELVRRRFFDKQFRKEEAERKKKEEKEELMIELALEDAKKGIKGAHIERAKEIQKARDQKKEETERLEKLAEARASLEKQLADAVQETADNTLATKEAVDGLRGDLTGGG